MCSCKLYVKAFSRRKINGSLCIALVRPLLVSVRFEQHGWDWSGAFVPDQLGDTQLKIRNLATGVTQILRVEVQNAMSVENELNDISSTDNSLGTYLILLSNDESGFMPYRIENFSLEVICNPKAVKKVFSVLRQVT